MQIQPKSFECVKIRDRLVAYGSDKNHLLINFMKIHESWHKNIYPTIKEKYLTWSGWRKVENITSQKHMRVIEENNFAYVFQQKNNHLHLSVQSFDETYQTLITYDIPEIKSIHKGKFSVSLIPSMKQGESRWVICVAHKNYLDLHTFRKTADLCLDKDSHRKQSITFDAFEKNNTYFRTKPVAALHYNQEIKDGLSFKREGTLAICIGTNQGLFSFQFDLNNQGEPSKLTSTKCLDTASDNFEPQTLVSGFDGKLYCYYHNKKDAKVITISDTKKQWVGIFPHCQVLEMIQSSQALRCIVKEDKGKITTTFEEIGKLETTVIEIKEDSPILTGFIQGAPPFETENLNPASSFAYFGSSSSLSINFRKDKSNTTVSQRSTFININDNIKVKNFGLGALSHVRYDLFHRHLQGTTTMISLEVNRNIKTDIAMFYMDPDIFKASSMENFAESDNPFEDSYQWNAPDKLLPKKSTCPKTIDTYIGTCPLLKQMGMKQGVLDDLEKSLPMTITYDVTFTPSINIPQNSNPGCVNQFDFNIIYHPPSPHNLSYFYDLLDENWCTYKPEEALAFKGAFSNHSQPWRISYSLLKK